MATPVGLLDESVRRLRRIGGIFHKSGPPAGARPGELAISASAAPPRLEIIDYDAEFFDEHDADIQMLRAIRDRPSTPWLNVVGIGDRRVLEEVGRAFDIHPLALADVVHVPQRVKVEAYPKNHFIILRMIRRTKAGEYDSEQVSLLLGADYLVTFQEREGDVFEPVRERLRAPGNALRSRSADFLAYSLIDALIDAYYPVVEDMGDRLEALEREVLAHAHRSETLGRLHGLRHELLVLQRHAYQHRDLVANLLRSADSPMSEDTKVYLRDAHDHAAQVLEVVETYREIASGLMDLFLSVQGARANDVMRVLTVMASIFIPLTFVVGVYGMNFEYMPELQERWGYPAVWGFMLMMATAMLLFFWRRGWLKF